MSTNWDEFPRHIQKDSPWARAIEFENEDTGEIIRDDQLIEADFRSVARLRFKARDQEGKPLIIKGQQVETTKVGPWKPRWRTDRTIEVKDDPSHGFVFPCLKDMAASGWKKYGGAMTGRWSRPGGPYSSWDPSRYQKAGATRCSDDEDPNEVMWIDTSGILDVETYSRHPLHGHSFKDTQDIIPDSIYKEIPFKEIESAPLRPERTFIQHQNIIQAAVRYNVSVDDLDEWMSSCSNMPTIVLRDGLPTVHVETEAGHCDIERFGPWPEPHSWSNHPKLRGRPASLKMKDRDNA